MKKKKGIDVILSAFLCVLLTGIGVFLFLIDNERRQLKLGKNNITIVLSNDKWTKEKYELTVKYSGDSSRHIKGYSFDGGKTWGLSNIYVVDKNQNLSIAVKDIKNKIYNVDYEIKNFDVEGPIIDAPETIDVQFNSVVNIDDYVIVSDNGSGLRDSVVYTPNKVNTKVLGEQVIQIYAIDNMANKTISSIKFNVVKNAPIVPITKVTLEKNNLTMKVSEENQLVVNVEPRYANSSRIKWTSSNPEIVKVGVGGKIVALAEGTATIEGIVDDQTVTCEIVVE